jgi:PilZ domain
VAEAGKQREHPRVRPAPGTTIEVHIMGDGFLEVLHARDISVGGVAVFVAHDFSGCDLNAPVDVIVKLGHEKPFTARGIIAHLSAHANDHFFGVKFTRISDDNLARIEQYVKRRLAQGGGA